MADHAESAYDSRVSEITAFLHQSIDQGNSQMTFTLPAPVAPPRRILMGPGPSDIPARVLLAMAASTVGHLDPYFLKIMDETQSMLRQVFRTQNALTLAVSGTGSAGMETVIANLIEPGDRIVVCVNGVFGGRMADVAARCGAEVFKLERPFGEIFSTEEIEAAIKQHRPNVLGIVNAETSTGANQPVNEIAKICHQHGTLIAVDCVTSLGGQPVEVDEWQLDAVYSGTQKCLNCPPGLAPVTFGERAVAAIDARQKKVQSWYLDMQMVKDYWGSNRAYHHTAPINMNYGLHEALRLVLEEGLESRFARHQKNHRALKAGLRAMGLEYAVKEGQQLPMLNAVLIPGGVDDVAVRKQLLNDFGIEIGGGLGAMKGKTWRIGLMGVGACPANVLVFLGALEKCLLDAGVKLVPGAGVGAANLAYCANA